MKPMREVMFEAGLAYCVAVLELTHGNVARAALIAGHNRQSFYKVLARYGVHGRGDCNPHRDCGQSLSP